MTLPERIDTERLVLRAWRPDDAADLRRAIDESDAHLRPWIPFMQHEPRSLDATRAWLDEIARFFDRGEHFRYAIRRRQDDGRPGELVGETMLLLRGGPGAREIGYWLHPAHCGHGYATEASRSLIRLAFDELLTRRIVLRCDERNLDSQAVARRLGAAPVGTEELVENGRVVRLIVFERPWDARDEAPPTVDTDSP
ncbi:MAG: GNAT family N-acetyltransferase [Planctomycetes bacterium]|nr:GNAT family N-acetyltransferase [Planctomycetota bacterium]